MTGEIFAQAYDASGARQGAEFRVNTVTEDNQYQPDVAALADGGFLITWTIRDDANWYTTDVHAQRFTATGTPVGTSSGLSAPTRDLRVARPIRMSPR